MTNAVGEQIAHNFRVQINARLQLGYARIVPNVMSRVSISETITQPERNRGITDPENVSS